MQAPLNVGGFKGEETVHNLVGVVVIHRDAFIADFSLISVPEQRYR